MWAAVCGLLLLWVVSWFAAKALVVSSPLDSADAIAVFSGSAAIEERSGKAAELFRAGKAAEILLTDDGELGRWSSADQKNLSSVERSRRVLESSGVPPDRINLLPGPVDSTHVESELFREYATAHRIKAIIFVTSAYHSRRAWLSLRRAFSGSQTVIGLETASLRTHTPAFWWSSSRGWEQVAGEWIKLLYYKLVY